MECDDPRRVDNSAISRRTGTGGAIHPVDMCGAPAQHYPARPFRRWFPWLLPSFVLVNLLLFVVTMAVNNCPKNTGNCVLEFLGKFSFQPLKENPLLGPSSTTLLKMGALDVKRIVDENQGWRVITCIWLHAGVFHLLFNMIGLLFIGIRLERDFGFVRIGLLYVIAGVGGSLLSALFVESGISVGASGALFGLLGGMLSELITNWTIYENKFAALTALVVIISVNLALGLLPRVDNFAHIGGFVSGFLLGFVFLIRPQFGYVCQKNLPLTHHSRLATRRYKTYQYVLWVLAAVLLIIGFVVGFILLFRGVDANDHCSWCHYLNCVPTSKWSCKQKEITCNVTMNQVQVNLTCGGTEKTRSFTGNLTSAQINSYCTQLCS